MKLMIFATMVLLGGAAQAAPQQAQAPTGDYPHCSRTVTDHCMQGGGMGHAMHHGWRGHHGDRGHHRGHGHHGGHAHHGRHHHHH